MRNSKNILVAPLNWGLGHSTRCIPLIKELEANDFNPIIASDGEALTLLKKEFPHLECISLPSYKIKYAKKERHFNLKMLFNSPKISYAVLREKALINQLIRQKKIDGIISDNRLGVYSNSVPSVYITHQLNVLSGLTTKLSTRFHQYIISKFDECWVPDIEGVNNLSGKLGHLKDSNLNIKYIGPLSRFNKIKSPSVYDYLVLLSGPEPQRTLLEEKLYNQLKKTNKKVLFIRGKIEAQQEMFTFGNITVYNYMTSKELELAINTSDIIVSRSGYTTIIDLAKLGKKAFFIPTPGQSEQQYLAKRLKSLGITPYTKQDHFTIEKLNKVAFYKGLVGFDSSVNFVDLFDIFNQSPSEGFLMNFSKVKENSDPTPSSLST